MDRAPHGTQGPASGSCSVLLPREEPGSPHRPLRAGALRAASLRLLVAVTAAPVPAAQALSSLSETGSPPCAQGTEFPPTAPGLARSNSPPSAACLSPSGLHFVNAFTCFPFSGGEGLLKLRDTSSNCPSVQPAQCRMRTDTDVEASKSPRRGHLTLLGGRLPIDGRTSLMEPSLPSPAQQAPHALRGRLLPPFRARAQLRLFFTSPPGRSSATTGQRLLQEFSNCPQSTSHRQNTATWSHPRHKAALLPGRTRGKWRLKSS